MGCDIHGVFQKKVGDVWEDSPSDYEFNRHYQLFAVLANVRNGYGFAGVRTGDAVEPISEPRGLPLDFEISTETDEDGNEMDGVHLIEDSAFLKPWRRENYPDDLTVWMGDHSHSWLTADEMLAWFENAPETTHEGVLSRKQYEEWDKVSPPEEYCGDIWGTGVVVIDEGADTTDDGWTYIRVAWRAPLVEELAYFFDEVRKLQEEHGEVRFVFGFDS